MSRLSGALLLHLIGARVAHACSLPPGVDREAVVRSVTITGWSLAGVSILAAGLWLARTRRANTVPSVLLLLLAVLNPGWRGGMNFDCGSSMVLGSAVVAMLSALILVTGFVLRKRQRTSRSVPPGV